MMLLYLGFLLVGSAVASFGPCPNIATVADFDVEKYLGKWYFQEHYGSDLFIGKCISSNYTDNNGTINVKTKVVKLFGLTKTFEGHLDKTDDKAKFNAVYPTHWILSKFPNWIVDTDYTSYALVYGCEKPLLFKKTYAWILTRERNPAKEVLDKAHQAADKNSISKVWFSKVSQQNCPADD